MVQNTSSAHFPYIIHGAGATVLPDVARRRRKRDFGGAAGDISQQWRRPGPPYAAFWIPGRVRERADMRHTLGSRPTMRATKGEIKMPHACIAARLMAP